MAQIVEKLSTDVAETVEVIELDIQMLCRVCGTIHETLIPIFDNEGLENEILDKINKYLPIRITQDGNLPSKICIKCANLLIMWNDLVLNCIETDKKLTNVLEFSDQYYEMKLKKTKDREKEEFEKVLNDVLEKNDMKKQLSANLEIGGEEQANIPYRREVTDNEAIIQENEENELDIIKRFEHPMTSTNQCSTSSAGATTFDNSDIANIKYEVIRAKKDNGTYSCTKCDYKCTKRTKFYNHMFESHNVQNKKIIESSKVVIDDKVYYQCSQCQKQLGSANTFSWHLLIHSGERPFVCDQCGKKFRISSGLSRHIKEVHENSREFACDLCDRKFGNRRNVIEHRRLHTNERPYVCDDCGKTFKQKASLFVHKRGHSLVFPFQCSECDLSFRTQPAMMLHVSVHSGHRPHACDMCDRKFRIKHELKKHKLTHSDVKPFSCDVCGLKFRQKRYVKRHYKSKHPELPLPDSVQ